MSLQLLLENNSPLITDFNQWEIRYEKVESPLREDVVDGLLGKFEAELYRGSNDQLKDEWGRIKEEYKSKLLDTDRRLYVYGPAQVADQRNGNGRVYPSSLWDKVLREDSHFMRRLRARQVLGELEHPNEANTKLPRVSHLVVDVQRRGNVIYAGHLIFRTPMGQIIEELYNCKVTPGVSSRAIGRVRKTQEGDIVEEDDFVLDTFDFVYLPSVSIARPVPVKANESVFDRDMLVAVDGNGRLVAGPASALIPPVGCTIKRLGEMSNNWLEEYGIKTFRSKESVSMSQIDVERLKNEATAVAESKAALEAVPVQMDGVGFDDLLKFYDGLTEARKKLEPYRDSVDGAAILGRVEERLTLIRKAMDESRQKERDRLDTLLREYFGSFTEAAEGGLSKEEDKGVEDNSKYDEDEDEVEYYRIRYEAACNLGEELLRRCREYKAMAESVDRFDDHRLDLNFEEKRKLEKKCEVAIGLGEELLTESRKRIKALESLLKAIIERYRKEGIVRYLLGVANKYPSIKGSVEVIARKCNTVKEAKELVEEVIEPVAVRPSYPTDLPPPGYNGSNGGTSPVAIRERASDLLGAVISKFEGR